MRASLPEIIKTLPDVILVPELIKRVNAANGLTAMHTPKASNTYSWTDIYTGIRLAGYKPTFITAYGHEYDDQGHRYRVPVLHYGFCRTTYK